MIAVLVIIAVTLFSVLIAVFMANLGNPSWLIWLLIVVLFALAARWLEP